MDMIAKTSKEEFCILKFGNSAISIIWKYGGGDQLNDIIHNKTNIFYV
jgi:hypothetical protein